MTVADPLVQVVAVASRRAGTLGRRSALAEGEGVGVAEVGAAVAGPTAVHSRSTAADTAAPVRMPPHVRGGCVRVRGRGRNLGVTEPPSPVAVNFRKVHVS
ncbi:hypothetical protein ACE1SV_72810 [Streptomyces sp. E-15]